MKHVLFALVAVLPVACAVTPDASESSAAVTGAPIGGPIATDEQPIGEPPVGPPPVSPPPVGEPTPVDPFDMFDACDAQGVCTAESVELEPADPPAEDECSDAQRKARLEAEAALSKKLIDNKCLPDKFTEEPCKGLRVEWEGLKDANARCNAKKLDVSLCTYYEDMVKKYKPIVAKCDAGEVTAPAPMGMTVAQYCDYGRMSLTYFTAQRDKYCKKD
jgi:hypothetical protein